MKSFNVAIIALTILSLVMILAFSSILDGQKIVEQMILDREYQKEIHLAEVELKRMDARAKRIQKLAYDCAAVATRDYSLDESAIWLALTGDRDPDDTLSYTDPNISGSIVSGCYFTKFKDDKYDDVRAYMYSH